jgi:hypothetical protein
VYEIVDTTAPQTAVDMSCDAGGQQYLLAWEDVYAGGAVGIWARVVHPDESMEPDFLIDQLDGGRDRTEPNTPAGTTNYLIAWEHDTGFIPNRDIQSRRFLVPEPAAVAARWRRSQRLMDLPRRSGAIVAEHEERVETRR